MNKKVIEIFSDGACRGNPGAGGWAAILYCEGKKRVVAGSEAHTTNNRMELMAAIEGLAVLTRASKVIFTTDSQYVKQGITQWLSNWKRRNWRTSAGKAVKNQDLWQRLDDEAARHEIEWHWVKGHSGHPGNEEADLLANASIDAMLSGEQH
ncbi:MAG: ribonuclease HI [Gammaproteobacteria bacterium]|nr:ribonuclease HI [Gammaproteobacteria bacterium]